MTVFPQHWHLKTVADVGRIDLGRQRHPDWHHGPEMHPYLRVANVFEDRIDATDLKSMDFSGMFERYRLHPGDVLLNEGQTPELLGRPAIYRGNPPDVAFTNSLIRFRAGPDVLPEWALIVFRRHMHFGRFTRESRITTNIAHLSAGRLKTVEFPVPPLEEQRRIVDILEDHLSRLDAAGRGLVTARRRADALVASARQRLWNESAGVTVARKVADVGKVVTGSTPSTRVDGVFGGEVPFITPSDIGRGEEVLHWGRTLSDRGAELSRTLPEGAVLAVCIGATLGKVGWISRRCAVNQQVNALLTEADTAVPAFLAALMASPRFQREMRSASSSTTLPILNKSRFSSLRLPVPPLDIQASLLARFASDAEAADLLSSEVERAGKKRESLQRALLTDAFSGRLTGASSDVDRVEELAGV